jgi:hypothetical protein
MRPLTADQLSRMRSCVSGNFPSTAIIARKTSVTDARGSAGTGYSNVATLACRIEEDKAPIEAVSGEQLHATSGYKVYFPAGSDVRPSDKLIIGSLTLQVTEGYTTTSNQVAVLVYAVRFR